MLTSGRVRLILVVAAVIAAYGSWFGWPGSGHAVALRPLGAQSALLVRGVGVDATLFRVDDVGRPKWRTRIRNFAEPFLPWGGLAVAPDRVALTVHDGDTATVRAISLIDGRTLWEAGERHIEEGDEPTDRGVFAAVAPDVFVMFGGGPRTRMFGLDAGSGATRWRRDLPGHPDRAWVRGHKVVVAGDLHDESYRLDVREGSLRSIHSVAPCVGTDRILYQSVDRIVTDRISGGDAHGRQVGDLFWLSGPCGERGGTTIALAGGVDRTSIVAYGSDLEPLWQLDLRGLRPVREGQTSYPDWHPLAQAPRRFVPLLLATRATGALQLVVVDLDERREAWRSPAGPGLSGFGVYAIGGVDYLMDTARIVSIDGDTGRLLGAVRLTGALPVQPYHVAGGKVWFASPSGDVGTLDGRTLIPDRNLPGVIVNDARLEVGPILGFATDDLPD